MAILKIQCVVLILVTERNPHSLKTGALRLEVQEASLLVSWTSTLELQGEQEFGPGLAKFRAWDVNPGRRCGVTHGRLCTNSGAEGQVVFIDRLVPLRPCHWSLHQLTSSPLERGQEGTGY